MDRLGVGNLESVKAGVSATASMFAMDVDTVVEMVSSCGICEGKLRGYGMEKLRDTFVFLLALGESFERPAATLNGKASRLRHGQVRALGRVFGALRGGGYAGSARGRAV